MFDPKSVLIFKFLPLAAIGLLNTSPSWAFGSRPPVPTPAESLAQSPYSITDSLVDHLPCSTLSLDTVLKKLQPDAFSASRHIPVHNWASGGGLAECWSLSHAQRLTFYMGRFDQKLSDRSEVGFKKYLETVADDYNGDNDDSPQIFPVEDLNSLIYSLGNGFVDSAGKTRRFQSDIEEYEDWRFYQPGNIRKILGSRDRPRSTNADTFNDIKTDLDAGRLPMVVLRPSITTQHAVLLKGMQPDPRQQGVYIFNVYDSNSPSADSDMVYDSNRAEFYAPDIIRYFGVDANSPVGVFLVDDDDMDDIQTALLGYYQNKCVSMDRSEAQVSGFESRL